MTRIGVLGAGGRMGQAIIAEIAVVQNATLAGGAERDGHPLIGKPIAPNLVCCGNAGALAHQSQVLVDFTSPAALDANIEAACEAGCALVVGTTGLKPEHHAAIDRAGKHIAILQAANTSLGVNMLAALVERATAALGSDWDVEIVEMHHRHKIDAPSGTALALGEAAAKGRSVDLGKVSERGRDGDAGPRARGAIGFASLRGGSVAGDHMVVLAADGERIELGHRAETREIFARGAVRAALWLAGKSPGRYGMSDVLGL